jgi:cbb3-type cytochrome oxidase subunit 3
MSLIMILYYIMSICLIGMLLWNFVREKKSKNDMLLYLIVAVPFILRVLRIK